MKLFENHFGRKQVYIFEGLLLTFTAFTYGAVKSGMDASEQAKRIWVVTGSAIAGPLAGAIARDGQSCCLKFSLFLLPFCGSVLLIGAGLQFLRLPFGRFNGAARITAWTLGLLIWFLGIPVSFLHAFS